MAVIALLSLVTFPPPLTLVTLLLIPIFYLILRTLYRVSPLHPLSHIPGPLLPRTTSLWLTYHAYHGDEATAVHNLHTIYGSTLRTGPNSVDISDGTALHDIYVSKGGFRKPAFYGNFDIDGHKSIFSEIVPENRGIRFKAVASLFAAGSLRGGAEVLGGLVDKFVKGVEGEAERCRGTGSVVNLLDLTRGLAVDAVTGYLFGRAYGGVGEGVGMMSASGMVDLFVGVGRFWYLPSSVFQWVDWLDGKFGEGSSKEVGKSLDLVDAYVAGVVDDAQKALEDEKSGLTNGVNGVTVDSYPARLLSAGISMSETRAQCKDLIFAGTDSTGTNLATIMFHLAKNPEVLKNLEDEIKDNKDVTMDLMEIQALPWLRGVVKEGLRLSMANPSRLPRVVPEQGWTFQGARMPAGTEISCTPFELHFNGDIFDRPMEFNPKRWIDDGPTSKEMERDAIPFGLGSRQCIARNLATVELFLAVKALVARGVMHGAVPVEEKIELLEWFNSHIVGGKVDMGWE